jgi:transposase-like protein
MSRMDHRKLARRVRRRFSDEFKEQTVRLVLDEGKMALSRFCGHG